MIFIDYCLDMNYLKVFGVRKGCTMHSTAVFASHVLGECPDWMKKPAFNDQAYSCPRDSALWEANWGSAPETPRRSQQYWYRGVWGESLIDPPLCHSKFSPVSIIGGIEKLECFEQGTFLHAFLYLYFTFFTILPFLYLFIFVGKCVGSFILVR